MAGIMSPAQVATAWPPNIVIHNVRKPLPFRDGEFGAIYASHLLEHLYLEEARRLLRDCWRVLKPHGVIRLVVPDLRSAVVEYLGARGSKNGTSTPPNESPADRLNARLRFRESAPPRGHILQRLYSAMTEFHSHKWMYDADSLVAHVKEAGFVEVAGRGFRESRISGIEDIELPERVLNGEGVCVEGVRPGPGEMK